VAGSAAVRETRHIAREHAEIRLGLTRGRRDARVQTQHLAGRLEDGWFREPLYAGQEHGDEVVARDVVRRTDAEPSEQRFEQLRQRRVGHVVEELRIVDGSARVEAILVAQTDHDLVDERVAEPRDLGQRAALNGGVRASLALLETRRRIEYLNLRQ